MDILERTRDELYNDPSLSEEWINVALTILSDTLISVEDLKVFGTNELMEIKNFIVNNESKKQYIIDDVIHTRPAMNSSQIRIYCNAISKAVHRLTEEERKFLCRADIPFSKMVIISEMMINSYRPLSNVPNIEQYNVEQLSKILDAMKSGINYQEYINPRLSSGDMELIKLAKAYGYDVSVEGDKIVIDI